MRFEKTALLGALLFAFSANAQDVMVDLSVLDDLDTPYHIDSKPLFPVLDKESIKKKIVKPKVEAKKEIVEPVVKDDTKFKAPIVEIKPLDTRLAYISSSKQATKKILTGGEKEVTYTIKNGDKDCNNPYQTIFFWRK